MQCTTRSARKSFTLLRCAGEWWLEYYRFFSAADVAALATASGRTLHLPADFSSRRELLRDTDRRHCRCARARAHACWMRGACAAAREALVR